MSKYDYPRVGHVEKKYKNTHARCPCGQIGKYQVHVQTNWFRGDDEVEWRCEEHKRAAIVKKT